MQPSRALLPATSYPKIVGEMCFAKIRGDIDIELKHPLVINQSGAGRQTAWDCSHAILACSCPIIDWETRHAIPNILSATKLSQHVVTQSEARETRHAIPACNNIDKLSQHAVAKS